METKTVKTSTIVVSLGTTTNVYRSIEEIPEPMRRKLAQITAASNTATILIADKRGKEELVRAIQGLPSSVPLRVTQEARRKREHQDRIDKARSRRYWLEIGLIAILAVLLWVLAVAR